jgi:hypothetical protein
MATWHYIVHLLKVLQKCGNEYCRVCGEFVIHSGYFSIYSKRIVASVD